ncbi:JAB domain-containing protein [Cephalotus follicularis]|uniref:JAB domain-containing protein n=1 Tax=Cephalotus follicularis TaxID=3775 RepID=A0A1Q3CM07_CEPFO|nr:JAB domain-containing protein [Cephalotus follicularis]
MRNQSLSIIDERNAELISLNSVDSIISYSPLESLSPTPIQTACKCHHITVHCVKSSPSLAISCTENAPRHAHVSRVLGSDSDAKLHNEPAASQVLQDVHISAQLVEDFLELARDNTEKDLETCGVLGAFLESGTFFVTTLIIPKQESTSSSCQATNEEELFAIQNEHSLLPMGWIHTHPSQACFMSSIDLHTHYSYQVMVPEAFAIVVAPTDTSRSSGLFRLTDPGGMNVVKECKETGFHPHKETADGSPLYEHCSNVYRNSNLSYSSREIYKAINITVPSGDKPADINQIIGGSWSRKEGTPPYSLLQVSLLHNIEVFHVNTVLILLNIQRCRLGLRIAHFRM